MNAGSAMVPALDSTRGSISLQLWDCLLLPAPGLSVVPLGVGETIRYVVNGQMPTDATATDPTGGVAIMNVPPAENVEFDVVIAATREVVLKVNAPVVAGAITYAFAFPKTR